MAFTLRSYYDGSRGQVEHAERYMTLAGYSGTDEAWQVFERRWAEMLSRWPCDYLHMVDAHALRGQFTRERGWTPDKVVALTTDVFNNCLSPTGWGDYKDRFVSACCTVNLKDHKRFVTEYPELKGITAATVCADMVIPITYRLLPEDPSHPTGRRGTVALYFDRNEPFEHQIRRVWERGKHPGPLQFVSEIGSVSQEKVYGIQAADLLAWHINRSHTKDDPEALAAKMFAILNTPSQGVAYMDYAELVKRYGAFGPDELAAYGVRASRPRRRSSVPRSPEPEQLGGPS